MRIEGAAARLAVAAVIGLLALAGESVRGQGEGPRGSGREAVEPPRIVEREAPSREAEVLEQSVNAEGAVSTVVAIPAAADAYIASEWPNQNFGDGGLYLGYDLTGEHHFGAQRMLLYFDVLSYVPDGAEINAATMKLRLSFSSPDDDAEMGTFLRRLCSMWSEGDVTWHREPAWREVREEADVGSTLGWYEWHVTDLVEGWVDGSFANHGIEVIGDEAVQERERAFYSRETSSSYYPRLVVDYTYLADTQPPETTVDDLPAYVDRDFEVSWSGKDPGGSGIASYDVQYRVDGGPWATWIVDATDPSAVFAAGQDGKFYEFRARGEDWAGNVEAYGPPESSTTVDAQPPSTTVDPLPEHTTDSTFLVSWTGDDAGSATAYYDVRYRLNGGTWAHWQTQTLATSAAFNALRDGVYDFEARAVDKVGNVEDFEGVVEASITVDTQPPNSSVDPLPGVTGDTSFTVSWSGSDATAGIQYYDVRYRFNGGLWMIWLAQTLATEASFAADEGDGLYEFEVRAVDDLGLEEPFAGEAEASIMVDAVAPFLEARVWLPLVIAYPSP